MRRTIVASIIFAGFMTLGTSGYGDGRCPPVNGDNYLRAEDHLFGDAGALEAVLGYDIHKRHSDLPADSANWEKKEVIKNVYVNLLDNPNSIKYKCNKAITSSMQELGAQGFTYFEIDEPSADDAKLTILGYKGSYRIIGRKNPGRGECIITVSGLDDEDKALQNALRELVKKGYTKLERVKEYATGSRLPRNSTEFMLSIDTSTSYHTYTYVYRGTNPLGKDKKLVIIKDRDSGGDVLDHPSVKKEIEKLKKQGFAKFQEVGSITTNEIVILAAK